MPIAQTLLRALKKPKETTAVTVTETEFTYEWRRDTNHNSELIGVKVARDFGDLGVFVGEVIALEYDSSDEAKEAPSMLCAIQTEIRRIWTRKNLMLP